MQDRTLAGHSGFAGVHVLAHGAPGEVAFAAGPLSLETIDQHRASLAAIGPALAKDGEVLLWSCETGRGARGAAFLAALAQASGASVAAATGRVGGAALGRGWALDGAPALPAPLIARSTGWGSKGKPTSGTWNTTTNDVAPTVVVSVASSNLKAGQDGSDRLQLQRAGGRLHQ